MIACMFISIFEYSHYVFDPRHKLFKSDCVELLKKCNFLNKIFQNI